MLSAASADEPFLPAENFVAFSRSGQCLAYADVSASTVTGARADDPTKKLWVVPEYHQFITLADDCLSVMALYKGGDLLDLQDHRHSTVVLSFFQSGELIRRVTLGDIYSHIDKLPQTVSHRIWMEQAGWTNGQWFIETVDGRQIVFDPSSGRQGRRKFRVSTE